jgi:hypothetical protein
METGFFIDADRHIYGPARRTEWWVRPVGQIELIEGRAGATGYAIHNGRVVTSGGGDTGFYLTEVGSRRLFQGPTSLLPWMPPPAGFLRPPRIA